MKEYIVSFVVGCAVGLAYSALRLRSPAPPLVAVVGLIGMLAGQNLTSHPLKWQQAPQRIFRAQTNMRGHGRSTDPDPR